MHAKFKECLDNGEIDPTPIWECDGRKAYMFTAKGRETTAARFLDYTDQLRLYYNFNLEKEDVDVYFEMDETDDDSIMMHINDPKSIMQIVKARQLRRSEMKNRRDYGIPVERTFVLGSFIVVEEDENPLYYDPAYNKEKIKRWKEHLDIEKKILLLRIPFPILGDSTMLLELSTLNLVMGMNQVNAIQLRLALMQSESNGLSKEQISILNLRMETLQSSENYLREVLGNITNT